MPRQPAQPGPTGRAVCPLTQRVAPVGLLMGASRNTPPNCGPPGSGRMPHGPRRGRQQAAWRPGASAISANATEQSPRVIYTARGHMGDQRTVLVAACYRHQGFPGSSTSIFGPCLFLKAGPALFLLCVSIGVPSVCVRGVWVGAFCAGKTSRPAPYNGWPPTASLREPPTVNFPG